MERKVSALKKKSPPKSNGKEKKKIERKISALNKKSPPKSNGKEKKKMERKVSALKKKSPPKLNGKEKSKNFRPWSDLPEDMLAIIVQSLSPNIMDVIRFGAMCKSWRSVATKEFLPPAQQMPWLMLAEDGPESQFRRFYSPSEDKIYKLWLPEACEKMCCSSSEGWLINVGKDLQMHLLNPFTRAQIQLPSVVDFTVAWPHDYPLWWEQNFFIRKVWLSSSPSKGKKCTALATYGTGRKLAFVRLGTPRWISISCNLWCFLDAVFYKGKFYAVNHKGHVVAVDTCRRLAKKIADTPENSYIAASYLVESDGDLLLVVRDIDTLSSPLPLVYKTLYFRVYRLADLETGEWERVRDLGDRALFLGLNSSMSISAQGIARCERNCIYFTDDYRDGFLDKQPGGGHDMGIYSLEDGTIRPHFDGVSLHPYSPPLWVALIL